MIIYESRTLVLQAVWGELMVDSIILDSFIVGHFEFQFVKNHFKVSKINHFRLSKAPEVKILIRSLQNATGDPGSTSTTY